MYFCEIVIGPPGSGKSTYVLEKSKKLEHRNLWTINLDPDNINKDFYNFNIDKSIKNYQIQNDMGPNSSTKELLNNFAHNINDFYHEYMVEKSEYFIFDLPGQIEFFINNDSLSKMINFFNSKNISVVIINMIDLVFFNTSLLSSYLFTYISVLLLEVPYVCVISKCDKYIDYCMDYELEDLINTNVLNLIKPKKKFEKIASEFLIDNFNQTFQILNYNDEKTVNFLQLVIDRCSGYCYIDDFEIKEIYYKNI